MGIYSYEVFVAKCDECYADFICDEEMTSDTEIKNALEEDGWEVKDGFRSYSCLCPKCRNKLQENVEMI